MTLPAGGLWFVYPMHNHRISFDVGKSRVRMNWQYRHWRYYSPFPRDSVLNAIWLVAKFHEDVDCSSVPSQ
jgi:hypothetical protein